MGGISLTKPVTGGSNAGNITNMLDSVISIYDNTSAIPTANVGDRYIALVTANGWTKNYVYTGNGATFDEYVPSVGDGLIVSTGTGNPRPYAYVSVSGGWVAQPVGLSYTLQPNRLSVKGFKSVVYNSAGTITVSPTAFREYLITCNQNIIWKLPVVGTTTTTASLGWDMIIHNNTASTTHTLAIQASDASAIITLNYGESCRIYAVANGATNASWKVEMLTTKSYTANLVADTAVAVTHNLDKYPVNVVCLYNDEVVNFAVSKNIADPNNKIDITSAVSLTGVTVLITK